MGRKIILHKFGDHIGNLTIICQSLYRDADKQLMWWVKCHCGNEFVKAGSDLRSGRIKGCGCLQKLHGMSNSIEYSCWEGVIDRCENPNNKSYYNYGGRGIRVCESWLEFKNFYADMGDKPSKNLSLERIDNNKGYSPDNCVWASRAAQNSNKRNTLFIKINQIDISLKDFVIIHKLNYKCALYHFHKGDLLDWCNNGS